MFVTPPHDRARVVEAPFGTLGRMASGPSRPSPRLRPGRVIGAMAAVVALAAVTLLSTARPGGAVGPPPLADVDLPLTPVATGLDVPLAMATRAGTDDIFIAEKAGVVVRLTD